ncbi:MAG: tyrosine-protein phosphatase [Bacteroidota bacterium]
MKVQYILALLVLCSVACADYDKPDPVDRSLEEQAILSRVDGQYMLETENPDLVILSSTGENLRTDNSLSQQPTNEHMVFKATDGADTFYLGERNLNVKGVPNLRDVGGMTNQQGYQLRWGRVFRSGKLADVDESEFERLEALGLKTIVDFRTGSEREEDPDNWPNLDQINTVELPIGDDKPTSDILSEINSEDFDATAFMNKANEGFVREHSDKYKSFFKALLDEANYPLLFHCSAGKDRAGFGTYLLLSALGVDADLRLDDYLLSNFYLQDASENDIKKAAQFYGIDQDKLRSLMNVKPEYIQGALDVIESEYGTVKNYLCEALEVCDPEIDRLKQMLLYDYKTTFSTERDSLGIELPANATGYHMKPLLEGAPNFRPFNLVDAEGPPSIRANQIYRSDALHDLSDRDLNKLEELGIVTVIDFRHQMELDEDPDRLPAGLKNYINPAITRNPDGARELLDSAQYVSLRRGFLEGRYAEVDSLIHSLQIDMDARRLDRYASFAIDYTDSYSTFMQTLIDPDNFPVVFHCQGGKDRAGFASAILLKTLGYSDQAIVNDFLTTNLHSYETQKKYYESGIQSLGSTLSAHSAHLMYGLKAVERAYGSFQDYLKEGLGLTDDDVAAIRENILL